jgi:regulator of protease activity HflC (stomatin/prohibitin superfamily)
MEPQNKVVLAFFTLFILIVLIVLFPLTIIGAGERAVVTRLGKINRTLDPGMHWFIPLAERVNTYSVRTKTEAVVSKSASQDLQEVTAEVTLNYNVNPLLVESMYVAVKSEYVAVIISPTMQEAVKAATAKFTAEQLITKRAEVTTQIFETVKKGLLERSGGKELLIPTSIAITNFEFSPTFNDSIENKVKAEQDALTAKNKLEQIKYEAQQTIATAQAQAESIKIQAQAINSQGGADYVQLQAINKWDGKLPGTFVPGSALPFINIGK